MNATKQVTRQGTQQATKRATEQLQRVYDYLEHKSGVLTTDQPDIWWDLSLEKEDLMDNISEIRIGVFRAVGGEVIYDPLFYLDAQMDGDRIVSVNLCRYVSEVAFTTVVIDENDRLVSSHGEMDVYGLRRRFSAFMDNVTEIGPYLKMDK